MRERERVHEGEREKWCEGIRRVTERDRVRKRDSESVREKERPGKGYWSVHVGFPGRSASGD